MITTTTEGKAQILKHLKNPVHDCSLADVYYYYSLMFQN